ncbi:MAG: DUF1631 domain-containing protein, partial [Kangiellaceae bacterium]|nr:DUF1631 domain-containing protein [Kangiellaceae bacterium]
MSNQVSKILADQYIKLCSLKVDRQHEADLIGRLLENIQTYETDNPKFKPTEDRPSTSNDVSTQQIFSVKDDVLASALSTEIENFPRIQLALNICDYCFLVLSKNSHIPPLLINLIEQLKPTYMRLCLLSPLEVIRGCNPVLKIINTIISYTPQWKDESSVNFPTYGKLLSLINFKTKSSDNLYNAVDTGLAKILQIKENQQKRGLIFERRLIEREASITLTRTANSICKKIIQDLSMKYELDGLLSSFLKDTWSRLIILEYVRKDNSSFIEIVGTFILLALSVRKLRNNDELTFLANNMPALNESIIRGLQKLSIGESEINEFLSSIESIHLKLIKEQTDNPANLSNDKSQSKTSKQEDIIRLDPIDVFATTTEQIEPSVKPSDTNADKQLSKLETSVKSELESSES